jgi:predicted component of type VI protein secretion system
VQFLMERLVNRADVNMGLAPPFDLAEAVRAQIQRIVASRSDVAGRIVRVDDFGMPSIVEASTGGRDLDNYGERLARAIAQYEPRLRDIRLEWVATGRSLRPKTLVVHGCLVGSSEPSSFRFDMPGAEGAR